MAATSGRSQWRDQGIQLSCPIASDGERIDLQLTQWLSEKPEHLGAFPAQG